MLISSTLGIILVVVIGIILILVVWYLTHRSIDPRGSDIQCGLGGTCPAGFRCAAGICLLQGECRSNNDCPGGDSCLNGRCQQCANDDQCPIGSKCTSGRCSVITCRDEQDCPNGFFCNIEGTTGIHLCEPDVCQNNTHCQQGESCVNNVCVTVGHICSTDRDCRAGTLRCLSGRCQQCQQNSDCPSGSCVITTRAGISVPIGLCVTGSSESCPLCRDGSCADHRRDVGEYCQGNEDCISGLCHNSRCQERGAECMLGDNTCPTDRPYCVSGRCNNSAEGLICVPPLQDFGRNTPCPEGYNCINGHCKRHHGRPGDQCEDNQDCTTGLVCEEKRCRRKSPIPVHHTPRY